MVRLLIIAHAPLASALKTVAAHIDPDSARAIGVVDVDPGQSQDDVVAAGELILDAVGPVEALILTDVFGATPCNAARRLGERSATRVIAGINVPAVWRAVAHLSDPLDRVAELTVAGGQQGVMHVTITRPQFQSQRSAVHDPEHDHHQQ
ncbi:PTS sugar transporter subunit IIA [Ideonella sp. A 288]|uniref:PTS sugar transporter subunit IIA n=1 Tax=Ideonella sp. A 288 TaxID=1962181 RepID=UPI000B4BE915|nr:PTS fructose transporter subunit IIA [Ideonella sp. A 288]